SHIPKNIIKTVGGMASNAALGENKYRSALAKGIRNLSAQRRRLLAAALRWRGRPATARATSQRKTSAGSTLSELGTEAAPGLKVKSWVLLSLAPTVTLAVCSGNFSLHATMVYSPGGKFFMV